MDKLRSMKKVLGAAKEAFFGSSPHARSRTTSSASVSSNRSSVSQSSDMSSTTPKPSIQSGYSSPNSATALSEVSMMSALRTAVSRLPIRTRAASVVINPSVSLQSDIRNSQMARLLTTAVSKPKPQPQQSHQQQNSRGGQNSSNNQNTSARNRMLATGAVMTGAGLLFGYYNRERSVETTKVKLDAQQALSDDVLLVRSNENIGQLKRSDQIHENQCVCDDAQALYDDEESRDDVIKKYKDKGYVISELNLILPWEDARAYPFDELLQARPAGTERGVNPDETFESISGADDNENIAINKVRDKLVSEARCGLTVTVAYNPHTKKAEIIHDKAEVGTTVFVSTDPKSKETSYVSVPGIALKHKVTCRVDDNGQVIVDAAVSAKGGLVAAVDAHRVAKDNLIKLDKDESVVVRGKKNIYDIQRDKLAEAVTPAPSATVTATINPNGNKMQVKLNHTPWPGISGSLTTNGKGIVFNGPAPISSTLTKEAQIKMKPVLGLTQGTLWRLKDAGTISYDNGQVSGNSNLTATTVDKDSYNSSNFKPVKTLSAPTETVAPTQSVTVKPN